MNDFWRKSVAYFRDSTLRKQGVWFVTWCPFEGYCNDEPAVFIGATLGMDGVE